MSSAVQVAGSADLGCREASSLVHSRQGNDQARKAENPRTRRASGAICPGWWIASPPGNVLDSQIKERG
jgi:hypothetical protein